MKKILAIDDQKDNLISIKAIIQNFLGNCEVVTALSGKEGIDMAEKEQPDSIILDIIMPGMDGYEVCRRLKENPLVKNIPVLLLTAMKTDSESRARGLDTGADAFLSKPIDPVELIAQVKVLLRMKESEERLLKKQKDLEKIVAERTRELVSTNFELKEKIVARNIAEEKLKVALSKAMEADRTKSAFLATISHELRTPLNAIIGFSDLIDETTPSEEILKFSRIINQSGNHLLKIVEGIFDITLIESGHVTIRKSLFTIGDILDNVHGVCIAEQRALGKETLSLVKEAPAALIDKTIESDQYKIQQILINLVKNSLKFTSEGEVRFGVTETKDKESRYLSFFVKDTGIGIPAGKEDFIFQDFTQIDHNLTRQYGGVGIGLSVAKKLVELLGGTISVDSEEGKGSLFSFSIPLIQPGENHDGSSSAVETPLNMVDKTKTILVAEDEQSAYLLIEAYLKGLGYKLIRALNGEEAVNICKENGVDLVLMDINMPVLDGYEATGIIKKVRPGLPVVAQTAYAMAGDREKALRAGCDDHIEKPVRRQALLQVINKHLKQ